MDKRHILAEIRRTAEANNGAPLGRARFQTETGITQTDWYAKYWRSWGDAVREAGYTPNSLQEAFDEPSIVAKLVELIRELGHYPVAAELRMKARDVPDFPSHNVFERIGTKAERARKVIEFCNLRGGLKDVIAICEPVVAASPAVRIAEESAVNFGFVYLIKFGRHHKIGRTKSPGRREYELAIQLPEPTKLVHKIKTDDPVGIEEYWHKRFRDKRRGGEWFELSASDIKAFKKRQFM
ncbi:MAG TPA: GIY-YIG nuclease family protein [Bryobacterales bacterium]|nr:GIY-YIG nuclease family protein [Bryobacterales bacterium]